MKKSKIIIPVIFLFVTAIVIVGINTYPSLASALYPDFLNQLLDNQPKVANEMKMPLKRFEF